MQCSCAILSSVACPALQYFYYVYNIYIYIYILYYVMLCHVTSFYVYYIILYRIISYHIIHHIISYLIILYYICCITYYYIFSKKVPLNFSKIFVRNIIILRRNERDIINIYLSSCKVPDILVRLYCNLHFL